MAQARYHTFQIPLGERGGTPFRASMLVGSQGKNCCDEGEPRWRTLILLVRRIAHPSRPCEHH